jgi:hypothetical protein
MKTLNLLPGSHDLLNERTFSLPSSRRLSMWIIAIIFVPLIVIALSTIMCELSQGE